MTVFGSAEAAASVSGIAPAWPWQAVRVRLSRQQQQALGLAAQGAERAQSEQVLAEQSLVRVALSLRYTQ